MIITLSHPKVREWTNGSQIIDSFWSGGELFVLCRTVTSLKTDLFGVFRFFNIGDNVEVSQDVSFETPDKVINTLFRGL